ncbi:MAG: MBL fold metallo-hydrolase [Planctomycetes bacterium]|nr:MBL fold metallo-hydrolase [Planctomycetota bacterium]
MNLKTVLGVGALPLLFSSVAAAQRDYSGVKIETTHVAGPIYMLEGSGGNIGVSAGEDGILIVDDQFAPLADKIRAALAKINKGDLQFVLNTHWHGDHVGGNVEFGREAAIVAHTNVRRRLSTVQKLFGETKDPLPKHALPVITFDDSLSIHFNGEEIHVLHFPHGHTDGDSVVFFNKSNVVHMGDHHFAGMFPFVDLDHGGDVVGMARNVKTVIDRLPPDVKIIPGHGPLSTLDDLKAYHRMLTGTTAFVRKRMDEGKTVEQITTEGLPREWDAWGKGFIKPDKWIDTIYKSLTEPK